MTTLPRFESQVRDEWVTRSFAIDFARDKAKGPAPLEVADSRDGTQNHAPAHLSAERAVFNFNVPLLLRRESAAGRFQST